MSRFVIKISSALLCRGKLEHADMSPLSYFPRLLLPLSIAERRENTCVLHETFARQRDSPEINSRHFASSFFRLCLSLFISLLTFYSLSLSLSLSLSKFLSSSHNAFASAPSVCLFLSFSFFSAYRLSLSATLYTPFSRVRELNSFCKKNEIKMQIEWKVLT